MVTEEEFRRRARELASERLKGLHAGEIPSYKIRVRGPKKPKIEKVKVIVASKPEPVENSDPDEEICMYTPEEKNEYKKNIKHRCFICGFSYKNDFLQYLVRGNCCMPCNVRIASYLKKTISRAECDLQLVERIAILKQKEQSV